MALPSICRLKLTIAYDGAPFRGWQSQAGGNTVQDILQNAFLKICDHRIVVHGAGRTDAGVHALAQCAHADVPERALDWLAALNANLPREIRVLRCTRVRANFHARFSARGKTYLYRLWNAPVLPPLELHRAWHLASPLDVAAMKKGAALFLGTHDFASFAANRGAPPSSTVRTISRADLRRKGAGITLTVSGDGFLYKMVRLMTGALVRIGQGKCDEAWLKEMLRGGQRPSLSAPAEGLYLVRVRY